MMKGKATDVVTGLAFGDDLSAMYTYVSVFSGEEVGIAVFTDISFVFWWNWYKVAHGEFSCKGNIAIGITEMSL